MPYRLTMKCKFCHNECDRVESHIIPAAFFRALKSGVEPLKLLSNTSGIFPKRSHSGIYDRFLCLECERRFTKYDDYAVRLLLDYRATFQQVRHPNGSLVGFMCKNYDYNLLKLFFISVLWRASASGHSFFRRIHLWPYEEEARRSIELKDPGDMHHFSVLLSCWDERQDSVPLHKAIMDPFEERWQGIRAVRLYLGEFLAHVKVDRLPVVDPMAKFVLTPDHDLVMIARDPRTSCELEAALLVLNAPQNKA